MSPEQFIKGVHVSVITNTIDVTQHLFETTDISKATDPYWIKAQGLFDKLDQNDRDILISMMRQSAVDTTSMMLGALDGSSMLKGQDSEVEVTTKDTKELLSGDLQELFLQAEELRRNAL